MSRRVECVEGEPLLHGWRLHGEPQDDLQEPPVALRDEPTARDPAGGDDQGAGPDRVGAGRGRGNDGRHAVTLVLDALDHLADLHASPGPDERRAQGRVEAHSRHAGRDERQLEGSGREVLLRGREDGRVVADPEDGGQGDAAARAGHAADRLRQRGDRRRAPRRVVEASRDLERVQVVPGGKPGEGDTDRRHRRRPAGALPDAIAHEARRDRVGPEVLEARDAADDEALAGRPRRERAGLAGRQDRRAARAADGRGDRLERGVEVADVVDPAGCQQRAEPVERSGDIVAEERVGMAGLTGQATDPVARR